MSATADSSTEYTIRVHEDDDGAYWAEVDGLPGCFASGFTFDELLEALQEAIALYVDDDPAGGRITEIRPLGDQPAPRVHVDEMRVRVPA